MPLQDWDDPATWSNAYRVRRLSDPNAWGVYDRDTSLYSAAAAEAGRIVNALNLTPPDTLLVIGAGFGWIANNIALITGCVVAAVDTSQYIQTRKAQDADVEILNADVSAGSGRAQVRQALGITGNKKATYALTENVISVLDDAEAQQLSTFLHNIADNVVHWTALPDPAKQASGHQDLNYNWKTVAEWKALLPNDLFIVCGEAALA